MRLLARWLMLGVALLAAACARAPESEGVITLRYASPYSPTHPFSRADIAWIDHVERESQGQLKIKPYWSGSLLSSEQNMLELRHGVADIALITPIYARGGAHAIRGQTGFYVGALTIEDQTTIYHCLAAEFPELSHEMDGLRLLAVQGGNLPGILTVRRQVRTLEDLRGLRIRAPSELTPVLRRLGADPVNMPMGEVYSAMAKHVIDGVVAPPDTFRSLHFAEVAPYYAAFAIPRGGYPGRAMSEEVFQRLPEHLQQVLRDSGPIWEAAMAREIYSAEDTGMTYGLEHGVQVVEISAADQARFDSVYDEETLAIARALTRFGIDGEPIFNRAKELVQERRTRGNLDCPRSGA